MNTCAECGFAYGTRARPELPVALRESARTVTARLAAEGILVRRHRLPGEWSILEYGCHVRDVLLMQRDRLYVALVEDEPSFKPMYREQRVAFDRYDEQAPSAVAGQLTMAAHLFAHGLEGLSPAQWGRSLIYNFPQPSRRDVEWMAHHTLHEVVHHLADIDRIAAAP